MKRFVFGFAVGAALMIGATANAEVATYVGRVIEGQFPVKVNGKTIDTPGIVVNGTSYLPTRVIAELAGFDVYFDADLGISLTKKVERVEMPQVPEKKPITQTEEYKRYQEISKEISELINQTIQLREKINTIELNMMQEKMNERLGLKVNIKDDGRENLDEYKRELSELENRLETLTSEKNQLEAWINEQIAQLNAQ